MGLITAGGASRRDKLTSLHFSCERATVYLGRQEMAAIRGCEKAGGHLVFDSRHVVNVRPSLALTAGPTHVHVWTRVQGGLRLTYDVIGGSLFDGRLRIRTPARAAVRVRLAEVLWPT